MKTRHKIATSLAALAAVSGCVTTNPERAYEVRQPKSEVVRTFTNFSDSLRCMDDLFLKYGVRNVVITSDGIPDATGKVTAGTKDMLISAISRMSVRSGAFTFVDFDQRQQDVASLQQLVGFTDEFRVPSYYIRGAITQLDEGVIAESVGGSVALTNFSIGASKDQVVSVISTDMNVGKLTTRQIMPGISANNSVVVRRSSIGGDAGATISKVGLSFNISLNNQEGMHQATRTLIELSAIEIAGKLTKVPYWRCLQIEQTNPAVSAEAHEWYNAMSDQERVTFVQRALAATGDYRGPISGQMDQSTRSAIGRYQARNGLIASGHTDFDLYKSLIAADLALGKHPVMVKEPPQAVIKVAPLTVSMTTPKGPVPTYKVKESLAMTVTTSHDAYLYCYYSDAKGTVARVFPNKFAPDSYVAGGRPTAIPSQPSRFGIVFDKAGATEQMLCIASEQEVGLRLPDRLKQQDLTPLPVRSLDEVAQAYRQADPNRVAETRMSIRVVN
jgi:curli biogenesis system outer membrane secretion channel CsgG